MWSREVEREDCFYHRGSMLLRGGQGIKYAITIFKNELGIEPIKKLGVVRTRVIKM